MNLKTYVCCRQRAKSVLMAAGFMLMMIGSTSFALAQNVADSQTGQELKVSDLLKLPGKVRGEGTNTKATGKYKLAKYRVEEVALPQTMEVEIGGQKVQANQAFRVTLIGGPFPVRAMPAVVWIDDEAIGYGVESEDLDSITVVTFDSSVLRDGATIYLSYGDKKDKKDREALPEKLKLDAPKGGNQ